MEPHAAVAQLKTLALHNLEDVLRILQWNVSKGIKFFRITSGLFPHIGDWMLAVDFPKSTYFKGDIEFARPLLEKIGAYAAENDIRLTFHSNPYCQLNSPNRQVLKNTLFDIMIYQKILNITGADKRGGILILHGGGVHGDKSRSLKRLETVLRKLPAKFRNIISLENDERQYNPDDLLPLCERLGIPFCFDVFHNSISEAKIPVTPEFIKRVCSTWTRRGMIPKFHLSEQLRGERFGAHSLYIKEIPPWMFRIARTVNLPFVDLMLECKAKELALLKISKKYPGLTIP